jgi:IS30 family transposase
VVGCRCAARAARGRAYFPGVDLAEDVARAKVERGRFLSLLERELIADLWLAGWSARAIAKLLERSPSTITRELARNGYCRYGRSWRDRRAGFRYGPHAADRAARARRARPKPRKLATDSVLWAHVLDRLRVRWSPRQIAKTPADVFPDQPQRRVSHETVYQTLYLQGRGELRRELAAALRSGKATRVPREKRRALQEARTARFIDPMVMISERPAEAEDRAVPGHWEGDLIIGKNSGSAIATLVERHTRYVLLARIPGGRDAVTVRDALITRIRALPAHLWRSLTWDQGGEMARHREFSVATGVPVYFCDPASPWLRGSNENTVSVSLGGSGLVRCQARCRWSRSDSREYWPTLVVPCVGLVVRGHRRRPGPLVLA